MSMRTIFKKRSFYSVALSSALSFALVAAGVSASTTLSTNVSTGGTLSVTGASTLSGLVTTSANIANTGTYTGTSADASSLAVGRLGATTPAFVVDSSTASQVAGLKVTGAATGGTVAIAAIDSGSNTNLTINGKGSGTIGIGSVSTGAVTITPATTITGVLTATGGLVSSANITVPAAYGLDAASAGVLNIGTTTATTINIGRSGQVAALAGNATVAGTLGVTGTLTASGLMKVAPAYSLDVSSAGALNIGTTTATAITVGKSGITTTFPGDVTVTGTFSPAGITSLVSLTTTAGNVLIPPAYALDVSSAGVLNIGTTTATTITIGRSGQVAALAGNATVAGTLGVTGLSTLGNASSTVLSANAAYFGGTATTSISTAGLLTVGNNITVPAAYGLDAAASGVLNIGTTTATTINIGRSGQVAALAGNATVAGTLGVTGQTTLVNASSTVTSANSAFFGGSATTSVNTSGQLTVGAGTALTALSVGICDIPATTVNATSTANADCTASSGSIATGDKIFLTATSSLPVNLRINAASSSATNKINIRFVNDGITAGNTTFGPISFYFWAAR